MRGKRQITHSRVTSQFGSKDELSTAMPLARWILCVMLLAAAPLWAQLTVGGISGTVKDSSGAVVPGARITITNDATRLMQTTVSTATGTYVFSSVPVGTYSLKASAK